MPRNDHTPHSFPHRTDTEDRAQDLDIPSPRNKLDPDKHSHLPSAEHCLIQRGCLSEVLPPNHRNAPADPDGLYAGTWDHDFDDHTRFRPDDDHGRQWQRPGEASHPLLRGRLSEQLRAALDAPCLFYPGGGEDIDPALLFTSTGVVSTVVYADYLADSKSSASRAFRGFEKSKISVSEDMRGFCNPCRRLLDSGSLTPADFGFASPHAFYPNARECRSYEEKNAGPDAVIGRWALFELESLPSQPVLFLYFKTEAIQTYINLWGIRGGAPLAVVVQNHSKGCFWTRLDGDCLLYAASVRLPKYLYVGDIGSTPWPGYRQLSRDRIDWHSEHRSHRALFESKSHFGINVHSPMHLWDGRAPIVQSRTYPDFKDFKLAAPQPKRA